MTTTTSHPSDQLERNLSARQRPGTHSLHPGCPLRNLTCTVASHSLSVTLQALTVLVLGPVHAKIVTVDAVIVTLRYRWWLYVLGRPCSCTHGHLLVRVCGVFPALGKHRTPGADDLCLFEVILVGLPLVYIF